MKQTKRIHIDLYMIWLYLDVCRSHTVQADVLLLGLESLSAFDEKKQPTGSLANREAGLDSLWSGLPIN